MRIEFKINGQSVQPDQIGDALQRAMLQQIEQGITDQVVDLRCPAHGEGATVTLSGALLRNDMIMSVSTCCKEFERTVLDALGATPIDGQPNSDLDASVRKQTAEANYQKADRCSGDFCVTWSSTPTAG